MQSGLIDVNWHHLLNKPQSNFHHENTTFWTCNFSHILVACTESLRIYSQQTNEKRSENKRLASKNISAFARCEWILTILFCVCFQIKGWPTNTQWFNQLSCKLGNNDWSWTINLSTETGANWIRLPCQWNISYNGCGFKKELGFSGNLLYHFKDFHQ